MSVAKLRFVLIVTFFITYLPIYAETLDDIYEKLGVKKADSPKEQKVGYIEDNFMGKRYALYIPEDYTPDKEWPVLLGLHYSTGSGADYIINWQMTAQKRGYILLCPDSDDNVHWGTSSDEQRVKALLKRIMDKYNVDKDRIYITGFSAGAHFSYYLGLKYTNIFKAIIPIGGSIFKFYDRGDISLSKAAGKHIPVYIIHGTEDNTVLVDEARRSKDILLKYGYEVEYEEIQGHGHTHPHQVNDRVFEWLEGLNE